MPIEQPTVYAIPVLYLDDILGHLADVYGCDYSDLSWKSFSYGDASYTLVEPEVLAEEVRAKIEDPDDRAKGMAVLQQYLDEIPAGVLVAVKG